VAFRYSRNVRLTATIIAALMSIECGPAPPPAAGKRADPTTEPWYAEQVKELTSIDNQANDFFKRGKSDEAAALVQNGEKISTRLLGVPQPTLAAMEAASDLDDLYGTMLLSNHNYGWARLMFQKNAARWKYWRPQTTQTEARLKQAQDEIAKCDREIAK
jgi:hypothetical protein